MLAIWEVYFLLVTLDLHTADLSDIMSGLDTWKNSKLPQLDLIFSVVFFIQTNRKYLTG